MAARPTSESNGVGSGTALPLSAVGGKLSAPGIPGLTYAATAPLEDGRLLQCSVWVAVKNGYRYSLVVYGDRKHNRAIDATMKQFVGRLRQIQPNHVAHAPANSTVRR